MDYNKLNDNLEISQVSREHSIIELYHADTYVLVAAEQKEEGVFDLSVSSSLPLNLVCDVLERVILEIKTALQK